MLMGRASPRSSGEVDGTAVRGLRAHAVRRPRAAISQQDRPQVAPRRDGQLTGSGGRPAHPDDELGVLGYAQHVPPERAAGLVDLEGLAERRGRQPEPGGGQQDGARGLPGAEPVERVVVRGDDHQQLGGVVGRAVPGQLPGWASVPRGNRRRSETPVSPTGGGATLAADTPSRAAGVAVGPLPQLGGVARGELLAVAASVRVAVSRCRIAAPVTGSSSAPVASRLLRQCRQVLGGHRPVAHPAPIGPPAVDRRGTGRRRRRRPATGSDRDGREVAAVLAVGHAAHLRCQPAGGEGDLQVVQGGPAAQDQIAAVRVGRDEVPVPVGVQLHRVGADPPAPGLGVVHRRRAQGVLDRCGEVRCPAHGGLQARRRG